MWGSRSLSRTSLNSPLCVPFHLVAWVACSNFFGEGNSFRLLARGLRRVKKKLKQMFSLKYIFFSYFIVVLAMFDENNKAHSHSLVKNKKMSNMRNLKCPLHLRAPMFRT